MPEETAQELVRALQSIAAERETLARRERELIDSLNRVLGGLGYQVVPRTGGPVARGRRRRRRRGPGRPPGAARRRRRARRRGPGRPPKRRARDRAARRGRPPREAVTTGATPARPLRVRRRRGRPKGVAGESA